MIKFIQSEHQDDPTLYFEDVEVDQFFIDMHGCLSQKHSRSSYCIIANKSGEPTSKFVNKVGGRKVIKKILPEISKIEFS